MMKSLVLAAFVAGTLSAPILAAPITVERVASFEGAMPTGVTVAPNGRIFVNFPQWGDKAPFTVGELKGGKVYAYPSQALNNADPRHAADTLISVQSVVADGANRLWILDTGAPGFAEPLIGGAKLVAVDLTTNRVVKTIVLDRRVVLATTYVNDLRLDLRVGAEGVAYITDSSVKGPGALIVVDLASGHAIRRMNGQASVMPDKGFVPIIEGKALMNRPARGKPSPWLVASDGIAISPDGTTLYYCALSSRHLFAVPTALLRDEKISDAELANAVVDLGMKGASDGLAEDDQGRVYGGDYEHNSIRRYANGRWDTLVNDARILWPDTLSVGMDGYLYFTVNQLHRQAGFHGGKDERKPPYELLRIKIDARPVLLK